MSEIKDIPKHWEIKKLGEVCTYSKGKKPAILNVSKTKDCSIPYINIKAFEKGIFDEYTNGEKCNLCNDDDLLMVWDGARCGLTGKAKKGAVGSTLMKILPKENIHKEYLYHFINSKFWSLNTKAKGVGIPHIEPTLLWNFELVVPPLSEQQTIVAKIEELLSELDNGKQQLLTAQQQLKVYRQSLLKWAFEGKLTNKKVKEGELPKGWSKKHLFEIAKLINGDRGKNYPNRNEYVENGLPFINTGHIEPTGKLDINSMNYITRQKFDSLNNGKVKKGDLVYCLRGATMGKTAIIDQFEEGAVASSLVIVRLNKEANYKYIYYYLISPFGKSNIKVFDNGTAQPNLSAKSLSLYLIPIPDLIQQQLIVSELESKLTVCDKIEETISQSLQQAETLRQSILKKAFEGRLV